MTPRKRLIPVIFAALTMIALSSTTMASAAPGVAQPTDYYVALGDSMSVGIQPDQAGVERPTNYSYADDLLTYLKGNLPSRTNLNLVKLGCSGETSTSLINGGICSYTGATSQLDAAAQFLAAHQGHIKLVTLDIGSNDVDPCVTATGVDSTCFQEGLATLQANLATITARLAQADPGVATRFIGLNYYDPYLADWLQGSTGQQFATQSVDLINRLNKVLATGYGQAGYRVGDVATIFKTTDFTDQVPLYGHGQVPENVAFICRLTWMCAAAPVGPNVHADGEGYKDIALAAEAQL
jgi:lysophospholipase L1-like esterase